MQDPYDSRHPRKWPATGNTAALRAEWAALQQKTDRFRKVEPHVTAAAVLLPLLGIVVAACTGGAAMVGAAVIWFFPPMLAVLFGMSVLENRTLWRTEAVGEELKLREKTREESIQAEHSRLAARNELHRLNLRQSYMAAISRGLRRDVKIRPLKLKNQPA